MSLENNSFKVIGASALSDDLRSNFGFSIFKLISGFFNSILGIFPDILLLIFLLFKSLSKEPVILTWGILISKVFFPFNKPDDFLFSISHKSCFITFNSILSLISLENICLSVSLISFSFSKSKSSSFKFNFFPLIIVPFLSRVTFGLFKLISKLSFKSFFLLDVSVFLPDLELPFISPDMNSNFDLFKFFFPGISPSIDSYFVIIFFSVFKLFTLLYSLGTLIFLSLISSSFLNLVSGIWILSLSGSNICFLIFNLIGASMSSLKICFKVKAGFKS